MPSRYTIFMSHAHVDYDLCRRYADALHDRFSLDVWLDQTNTQMADSLPDEISDQLEKRSALVLMLTRASNASPWVGHELDTFIAYASSVQMVHGVERVVLPIFLEEDLPSMTEGRAANLARVRGGFYVEAAHLHFDQVLAMIAQALGASGGIAQAPALLPARAIPQTPSTTRRPMPGQPAMHARLTILGFVERIINGVAVIIPPLCDVPAGKFLMGSKKSREWPVHDNEMPQYRMSLDSVYQIGTYPVTVAEYACAVRAKALREPPTTTYPKDAAWVAPEWRGKEVSWQKQQERLDHPVVMVSWHDALAYARWLAKVTGQSWHLPTEVEWEKAARGSDGRIYPWGNQWDRARANTHDGGPQMTTPVGAYADKGDASPAGVHDLAGNVWEWTSSLYQPYPHSANGDGEDSDAPGSRVLRGGSWFNDPGSARVAYRYWYDPDALDYLVGFRLVQRVAGSL